MELIYDEYNGLELDLSVEDELNAIADILEWECFRKLDLNSEQKHMLKDGIKSMLLEYCEKSLEDMEYCFKDNIKEYFDNRAYMIYKNKD